MSTITLRQVKGQPLSVQEVDANFTNLNNALGANNSTTVPVPTGTGNVVLSNSATLVAPVLGTPASGVLSNCTGLPISTGVSGLAAGVSTFLTTPSSANLATLLTNETGTGSIVFNTSPTLITPILGTPASGDFSTGSFTWPTFNQNTTGNAATVTTVTPANIVSAIAPGSSGRLLTSNGTTWVSSAPSTSLLTAAVAPGSYGNLLTSNGTTWVSSPAVQQITSLTSTVTGILPIVNGGTGTSTGVNLSNITGILPIEKGGTGTTTGVLSLNSLTTQSVTGVNSVSFSIPSGTKRITVLFLNVVGAANATSVRVGSGGVAQATGYVQSSNNEDLFYSGTTGFTLNAASGAQPVSGSMVLHNITGNTWISNWVVGQYSGTTSTGVLIGGGNIVLTGVLNILTVIHLPSANFYSGSVNVLYE